MTNLSIYLHKHFNTHTNKYFLQKGFLLNKSIHRSYNFDYKEYY